MIDKNAVWLITGCSSGLGRALAEQVLDAGYRLVATARDPATLEPLTRRGAARTLALALDVTDAARMAAVVVAAEAHFGAIDVLVNNAGYGYLAALEEGVDADVHALFETNVFGPWRMARAVLSGMRARGRGHVVNVSSVGGLLTYPAVGFYHMSKFAIEGFSETLAQEIAPFGLGVTVVEPGAFRTAFRGRSSRQSALRLPAYAATAGQARDRVLAADGQQENDPVLGARAIIAAVASPHPPLHLVLGNDALVQVRKKLADFGRELDTWEALTRSTRFAVPAAAEQ